MRILSVNVGQQRTQPKPGGLETTGIYKLPAQAPVLVTSAGLPGDFIGDLNAHGGPDQAVYLYGAPDYAWWSSQLGQELEPGTFGENITLAGFESAGFHIGDRLQIGSLLLEFTAPRTPCSTFARRMADPQFVSKFRAAERPGVYCRVLREGSVTAGDEATLVPYAGTLVTNLEVFRARLVHGPDSETVRRILEAPLAMRARRDFERDLRQLQARGL